MSLGSTYFIPLSFCFWNQTCLSFRNFLLSCQAINKELLFSGYKIKGLTVKPSQNHYSISEVTDVSTENIAKFCEKETPLPKAPFPHIKTQTKQRSPQNNNDPETVKLVAK